MYVGETRPLVSCYRTFSRNFQRKVYPYSHLRRPRFFRFGRSMTTAITQYCSLGWGKSGKQLPRAPSQTGWLIRDATAGGRHAHIKNEFGEPLIVAYDITTEQFREALHGRYGCMAALPTDQDGQVIPGAPIAYMRIERPAVDQYEHMLELFGKFISFVESKDVLITNMASAVIESNRAIHTDTSDLMRAATSMLDVSSGMQRPDLDVDMLSDRVAEKLEKPENGSRKRGPWIVELLNGEWGQQAFEFASNWLGITNHNSTNKEQ